jgi:hypothetical protein
VMLFGVPKAVTAAAPPLADDADAATIKARLKSVMQDGPSFVQGQTDTEGSYSIANVPPGDYYVFAMQPGYVSPMTLVQADQAAGVDLSKPLPGVPMVHVSAEHTSTMDLAMQRGAVLTGRVLWDDGEPVPKAIVQVVDPKGVDAKGDEITPPPQFQMLAVAGALGGGPVSIADDRGQYRIVGLPPGSYLVKATVQLQSGFAMQSGVMNLNAAMSVKPLVIYAPAELHRNGAKAVDLVRGEVHEGTDITVNLGGMHSVSGRVTSAEDHHGINSGTVQLRDATDKTFVRSAGVDEAGNFTVAFVPAGTYKLTVMGAADTEPSKKAPQGIVKFAEQHTLRSYDEGSGSVIVTDGDVTGQNVELTPSKTTKKDLDMNDLLKE